MVAMEDVFSGQLVGQGRVPLSTVHRCSDDRVEPPSQWLNLCGDETGRVRRAGARSCLPRGRVPRAGRGGQCGEHVRATSKQLSKPPVGMLSNYALTAVRLVGVRKMGKLELSIRFTCTSWLTMMQVQRPTTSSWCRRHARPRRRRRTTSAATTNQGRREKGEAGEWLGPTRPGGSIRPGGEGIITVSFAKKNLAPCVFERAGTCGSQSTLGIG